MSLRSLLTAACAAPRWPAFAAAALALVVAGPAVATPVTLDFETPITARSSRNTYRQGDYTAVFSGGDAAIRSSTSCSPHCPTDGSDYLMSWGGSVVIMSTLAGSFSLAGFDAVTSAKDPDSVWAPYIDAIGVKGDGSTVSQRFALDVVQALGAAAAADFQTFDLGTDFSDLRSLTLRSTGGSLYALDNIRVDDAPRGAAVDATAVPEPGTLALVAAAVLAAVVAGRRPKAGHAAAPG